MENLPKLLRDYGREWLDGWNRFWFSPVESGTLGLIRLCAGLLIFYTHLVWSLELAAFFGEGGLLPEQYRGLMADGPSWAWSHFDWLPSQAWLWPVHLAGLAVMLAFAAGFCTRVTSVLTALLVISYANRATGALFGLDQINGMLALYLAIGPCGDRFSVDALLRRRKGGSNPRPKTSGNIALRLIQIHMCIIYLFAGMGKLQGITWWNGQALWGAVASYEYQTVDLTFLAGQMWLVNLLTWGTVAWEASYPFLIWHRLTRPLMLGAAVAVHLGIGMFMGMMTFGIAMIIGNLAFVPPQVFRRRDSSPPDRAG